jgi:D-arabinose 1-dehydrogenase-like Zn-dependent alcohol dehydrogenase
MQIMERQTQKNNNKEQDYHYCQMLAAVVPGVNAKWEVKEVPDLKPGTNQVLIKIHASGICYTDVHITKAG